MYFFLEPNTGHLVTFIWDIVWAIIDFILMVTFIILVGVNFHWYKAAEILFYLWMFTFVSVVRPLTYFYLKKKDFSSDAITCVCITRVFTLVFWCITLFAGESVS